MQSLTQDPLYFAQIPVSSKISAFDKTWTQEVQSRSDVAALTRSMLGSDFELRDFVLDDGELNVYKVLSQMLPLDSQPTIEFFWRTFCGSFYNMLVIAEYPVLTQVKLLVFFYARILGMFGPHSRNEDGMVHKLTPDGSPCGMSWVLPDGKTAKPGQPNRKLRVAVHPTDPRNGKFLKARDVMNYFCSPTGGMGLVSSPEGARVWSREVDHFSFGEDDEAEDEGLFLMGFDIHPSGQLLMRLYFQPPVVSSDATLLTGTNDFTPLRGLVRKLNPSMMEPLEALLEYFASLPEYLRPRFHLLAVDLTLPSTNRLKIYVATRTGLNYNQTRSHLTLGGRLNPPGMDRSMELFETLWNSFFTGEMDSKGGREIRPPVRTKTAAAGGNGKPVVEKLPEAGLGYYFEIGAYSRLPSVKLYLPARHYTLSDADACDALEKFYDSADIRNPHPSQTTGKGWVGKELAAAFTHRPLSERANICNFVTFGHKDGKGWDTIHYFCPEVWQQ